MQHEYGIFGGDDGAYVLDFLAALRVPAIVTLHTVLENPSESQRTIVQKMADGAVLVVMSQVAADLLARRYDVRGARSTSSRTGSRTWPRATRTSSRARSASPATACC